MHKVIRTITAKLVEVLLTCNGAYRNKEESLIRSLNKRISIFKTSMSLIYINILLMIILIISSIFFNKAAININNKRHL